MAGLDPATQCARVRGRKKTLPRSYFAVTVTEPLNQHEGDRFASPAGG